MARRGITRGVLTTVAGVVAPNQSSMDANVSASFVFDPDGVVAQLSSARAGEFLASESSLLRVRLLSDDPAPASAASGLFLVTRRIQLSRHTAVEPVGCHKLDGHAQSRSVVQMGFQTRSLPDLSKRHRARELFASYSSYYMAIHNTFLNDAVQLWSRRCRTPVHDPLRRLQHVQW